MNYHYILIESMLNRAFELATADALNAGIAKSPIYLSVGTEHIPPILNNVLYSKGIQDYTIFPQHRCHSYFLTFSDNRNKAEVDLVKELCGRVDGCGNGMTGSASLHIPNLIFGHDGLLGSNAAIACGYAQATGKKVICVLGDAACEEDYVLASLGYAATHNLPILFLVENNGLSILTKIKERRSWSILDVAEGFGIPTFKVNKKDKIVSIYNTLSNALDKQFSLIEIDVVRHLWHAGSGKDQEPEHDVLEEIELASYIHPDEINKHRNRIRKIYNEI